MERFVGTWHFDRSENLEEFMIATGIGYANREIIKRLTPTVEMKWSSGKSVRVVTSVNRFLRSTVSFTLDEEYEEKTPLGDIIKGSWTIEDGAMVALFVWMKEPDKVLTIKREISEDGKVLKATSCSHGVTSIRYFKRK